MSQFVIKMSFIQLCQFYLLNNFAVHLPVYSRYSKRNCVKLLLETKINCKLLGL